MPIRLVVFKVANIGIAIAECVLAKALLDVVVPVPLVCFPVLIELDANTVLLVVSDLTLIVATSFLVHHRIKWM